MAARTNRTTLNDKWREKIKTSMLINRLSDHVLGTAEMSSTQIRAAEILLSKTLPSLSATSIDGNLNLTAHEEALDALDGEGDTDSAQTAG